MARQLCCLVIDDPAVVLVGKEPILDGGRPVGYVTSAGYGATSGEHRLRLPAGRAGRARHGVGVQSAGAVHG